MEHGQSYKLYMRQISAQCGFDSHELDQIAELLHQNKYINSNNCWVWIGGRDSAAGYGGLYYKNVKYRVSRLSAMLYLGLDISDSTVFVCHKCNNPLCFNPDHLYLGDAESNRSDSARNEISKTHCNYGHELTPENIYLQRGWRSCLKCRRDKALAYYNKNKR